jgi:hypothetical protein
MRRVLLIMPLLVVLVACGGSSKLLTTDEITTKMRAEGLCRVEPTVANSPLFPYIVVWECSPSVNGDRVSISVFDTRESFRAHLRNIYCQSPTSSGFFGEGNAWGGNWITSDVADDGATSAAIARALGGDYSDDPTEVCKDLL